jgi:hypothetical protein
MWKNISTLNNKWRTIYDIWNNTILVAFRLLPHSQATMHMSPHHDHLKCKIVTTLFLDYHSGCVVSAGLVVFWVLLQLSSQFVPKKKERWLPRRIQKQQNINLSRSMVFFWTLRILGMRTFSVWFVEAHCGGLETISPQWDVVWHIHKARLLGTKRSCVSLVVFHKAVVVKCFRSANLRQGGYELPPLWAFNCGNNGTCIFWLPFGTISLEECFLYNVGIPC